MKKSSSNVYVEPSNYFPKEIRKKYKIGDFEEKSNKTEKPANKQTPKK